MYIAGSPFSSRYTILQPFEETGLDAGNVVLTFDDGPIDRQSNTLRLLDVLERHQVKAYFCIIGKIAETRATTIQEIHNRGHILVNHTYSHKISANSSPTKLKKEIEQCDQAINDIIGETPHYFRPVAGALSKALLQIRNEIQKEILPVTFFTFDTWANHRKSCLSNLLATNLMAIEKDKGGILVLHEQRYSLREEYKVRGWLPDFIDKLVSQLKNKNYKITTL